MKSLLYCILVIPIVITVSFAAVLHEDSDLEWYTQQVQQAQEPEVEFATFLGGSGHDSVNGITTDPDGNIIAVGSTGSTDFPILNAHQSVKSGGFDAYVAKIDPENAVLLFSTYLGGSGTDYATAVVTDGAGNIYVLGVTTSGNFPTLNAVQPIHGGMNDIFASKFAPDGTLLFSTYLGGSAHDTGQKIVLYENNDILITGFTHSANFPTVNAVQTVLGGGRDAYVLGLKNDGSEILFSTYVGGLNDDDSYGIVIDPDRTIYIAGSTQSPNFATQGRTAVRQKDIYVAALYRNASTGQYDSRAVSLIFDEADIRPTDLDGDEQTWGLAYDSALDYLIVTGDTKSTDFPAAEGAFQESTYPNSNSDGFVVVVDPAQLRPVWSAPIGNVGNEICWGVGVVGPFWNLYCTSTSSIIIEGVKHYTTGSSPVLPAGVILILSPSRNDTQLLQKASNPQETEDINVPVTRLYRFLLSTSQVKGSGEVFSAYLAAWSNATDLPEAEQYLFPSNAGGTDAAILCIKASNPWDLWDYVDELLEIAERLKTVANKTEAGNDGDPVNTFTGELYFNESPDLYLGGPLPLYFDRYYASFLQRDGFATSSLGANWSHTFNWKILRVEDDAVAVVSNRGRVILYQKTEDQYEQLNRLDAPSKLMENDVFYTFGDVRTGFIYSFHKTGRLASIEDGRGNKLTLTYSGGLLASVTDGFGRTLYFSYKGGFLTEVSDGTRSVTYEYRRGDLVTFTDVNNGVTDYRYHFLPPKEGLLILKTYPAGNVHLTQTYDDLGRVVTQTDAMNNTYTFDYLDGNETRITDPLGNQTIHIHSPDGKLISVRDPAGENVTFEYDDRGRRNRIIDRLGSATGFIYDETSGLRTSLTEANGAVTTFGYTTRQVQNHTIFDLSAINYPDGTSIRFTHDGMGNPTSITDERDNTWNYTFNERGQILSATNPKGGVITSTYNQDGTPAASTDPAGNTTTFGYDNLRRLIGINNPDGTARNFTYDANNRVITATDERSNMRTFNYDSNGNLVKHTYQENKTIQYDYDDMDRLVTITDPLGNISSLSYNALGLLGTSTDPAGNTMQFGYDERGNLSGITDGAGQTLTIDYNAEGILSSMTNAAGETNSFDSNEMGWITQITDATAGVTGLSYDSRGRITSVRDALGNNTLYSYDARGLVTAITLPGGVSAAYILDALGYLTDVIDPNRNTWHYTRDAMGRLLSMVDPLGNALSYTYDSRHRVTHIQLPGGMGTVQVVYDGTSNITGIVYSDGTNLDYVYNAKGELISANGIALERDVAGRITSINGIGIGRDTGGRIISMMLPGGVIKYTYDARNLITEVEDWLGGKIFFGHDAAGRLRSITRPNGVQTTYVYDSEGRFIEIVETRTENDPQILTATMIVRDALGNITGLTRESPLTPEIRDETISWMYDAASRIENLESDALGRLRNDGRRTYTWDLASRLTRYNDNGNTVTFTYDALSNRLTRQVEGAIRHYVWNYAVELSAISVEKEGAQDLRYYVHTPAGMLLYSIEADNDNRRYYHFDEMGNTLLLTDDNGDVLAAYLYSPYGEILAEDSEIENVFTFQGQFGIIQENENLFSMRARYYDATMGRFLTRDPVLDVDPQSINPYQYALGNPLRYFDPKGKRAESLDQPISTGDSDILNQGVVFAADPVNSSTEAIDNYYGEDEDDEEVMKVNMRKDKQGIYEIEVRYWVEQVEHMEKKFEDSGFYGSIDFDSEFFTNWADRTFHFRGRVMSGAQLNYYFQGMYWARKGVTKAALISIIYSWNFLVYQRRPDPNQMFAAFEGYDDTMGGMALGR